MRKAFLAVLILLLPFWIAADGFVVDHYAVIIEADSSRTLHVQEDITLEYTSPAHGFIRDVQHRFGTASADIDLVWASSPVAVSDDGTFLSVRFGDPDKLLTGGPYDYALRYDYSLGADSYRDYDELYYNIVTPGAWPSGIGRLDFSVTLPYPVDRSRIWLTSGPEGAVTGLPFTLSDDGLTVSGRYSSLPEGYGVTLRIEMDDGYFDTAARRFDAAGAGFIISLGISFIMVAVSAAAWWFRGRDRKIIAPVRFSPPEDLSPMDAGYILRGTLAPEAISAMVFSWADRKLVSIEENGKGDFSVTRLSSLPDGVPEPEEELFRAFFASSDTVSIEELRMSGFPERIRGVQRAEAARFSGSMALSTASSERLRRIIMGMIAAGTVLHAFSATLAFPGFLSIFVLVPSLMGYGAFSAAARTAERSMHSRSFRLSGLGGTVFLLIFLTFFITTALIQSGMDPLLSAADTIVFLAALAISLLAAAAISRRTGYAEEKLSQIMGYREFIDKAEKDRLERLSGEDPEFFYHVLPYAMAFGLERRWTEAFSGIAVSPASWYHGSRALDAYVISSFSRHLSSVSQRTSGPAGGRGARTFRGSSGFSGGGFSGGGGRSW